MSQIKEKLIQDYVSEHHRAPSHEELQGLLRKFERDHPSLDSVGFVGYGVNEPQYRRPSSRSRENANRYNAELDFKFLERENDALYQLMEDIEVGLRGSVERMRGRLHRLESRLDSILLGLDFDETFVGFIEEDFNTNEFISSASSAKVESAGCTLGRSAYSRVDSGRVTVRGRISTSQSLVNIAGNQDPRTLAEDDGEIWSMIAYTRTQTGRVTLELDFRFAETTRVGDIRINSLQPDMNGSTRLTVMVSQSEADRLSAVEPAEIALEQGENIYSLGRDNVKHLRLVISKSVSDTSLRNGEYAYIFSFDSVQFYTDEYKESEASLIAGPYPIKDHTGQALDFSKAKLEACTICPEGTSVDFFLSKDGTNWIEAPYRDGSFRTVLFGNQTPSNRAYLDGAKRADALAFDVIDDNLSASHESYLNAYIPDAVADKVNPLTVVVKRNLPQNQDLNSVPSGWHEEDDRLTTTIYIQAPEGRYLDFGNTSAFLNGSLVSGRVFVPAGYSKFSTSKANAKPVPPGLESEAALRDADPLYPYNHRYMIESYPYPSGFRGAQVYGGVDEFFGFLLRYVSPERFNHDEGFNVFTLLKTDLGLLVKVNTDKNNSAWREERFSLDWVESDSTGSSLYVKALLNSRDSNQSALLKYFTVRAI